MLKHHQRRSKSSLAKGGGGGMRALARITEGAARLRADAATHADLPNPARPKI
jgi:hypothetical protein